MILTKLILPPIIYHVLVEKGTRTEIKINALTPIYLYGESKNRKSKKCCNSFRNTLHGTPALRFRISTIFQAFQIYFKVALNRKYIYIYI